MEERWTPWRLALTGKRPIGSHKFSENFQLSKCRITELYSFFCRLVHLDLKGAPPRVCYFEKVCYSNKQSFCLHSVSLSDNNVIKWQLSLWHSTFFIACQLLSILVFLYDQYFFIYNKHLHPKMLLYTLQFSVCIYVCHACARAYACVWYVCVCVEVILFN